MLEITFLLGGYETIELGYGDSYEYDHDTELFIVTVNGYISMFPREVVRSIRYIEVDTEETEYDSDLF